MNRWLSSGERGVSAALSVAVLILVAGSALAGYSYYHNSQAQEEAIDSLKGYGLTAKQAENFHESYGDSDFVLPWESAPDYGDTPEKREVLDRLGGDYGAWSQVLGDSFTQEAAEETLNGNADGDNMANAEDPHPLRHDYPVTSEYEGELPTRMLKALRPLDEDLKLNKNDEALAQRLADVPEKVLLREKMRRAVGSEPRGPNGGAPEPAIGIENGNGRNAVTTNFFIESLREIKGERGPENG